MQCTLKFKKLEPTHSSQEKSLIWQINIYYIVFKSITPLPKAFGVLRQNKHKIPTCSFSQTQHSPAPSHRLRFFFPQHSVSLSLSLSQSLFFTTNMTTTVKLPSDQNKDLAMVSCLQQKECNQVSPFLVQAVYFFNWKSVLILFLWYSTLRYLTQASKNKISNVSLFDGPPKMIFLIYFFIIW